MDSRHSVTPGPGTTEATRPSLGTSLKASGSGKVVSAAEARPQLRGAGARPAPGSPRQSAPAHASQVNAAQHQAGSAPDPRRRTLDLERRGGERHRTSRPHPAQPGRTEPLCTTGLARPGPGSAPRPRATRPSLRPENPPSAPKRRTGVEGGDVGRGSRWAWLRGTVPLGAGLRARGSGVWPRDRPPTGGTLGVATRSGRGLWGRGLHKAARRAGPAPRRRRAWWWGRRPPGRSCCCRRSCRCRRWRWASRTAAATPRTCLSYSLSCCCCCVGSQPAVSDSAASGNGYTASHTCHQHLSLVT
ncbi:transmembrane protein 52 isoform X2 [Mustela putorius furo]|uniref:Transmembrane protein 52 isoform X2 n=1 Tax=Mustela putorius furo TaxID=9669 RepID=A0A8U0ULR5_MUSPF|nr:transmembrane protein 52 isoform X2 [Mustela putorius furo]